MNRGGGHNSLLSKWFRDIACIETRRSLLRDDRGGQAPALRYREDFLAAETAVFPVGRGPVPRHAAVYRMIAGDRPPRYGNRTVSEPKTGPLYVGRGPVPRRASVYRPIAGDRPPRYGNGTVFHNSVVREHLLPNGSGSGDPDLQA